jgi:hypothetical protein
MRSMDAYNGSVMNGRKPDEHREVCAQELMATMKDPKVVADAEPPERPPEEVSDVREPRVQQPVVALEDERPRVHPDEIAREERNDHEHEEHVPEPSTEARDPIGEREPERNAYDGRHARVHECAYEDRKHVGVDRIVVVRPPQVVPVDANGNDHTARAEAVPDDDERRNDEKDDEPCGRGKQEQVAGQPFRHLAGAPQLLRRRIRRV